MGNPPIQEKLKTVSALIKQHKDLRKPLELQEKLLLIQMEINNVSKNCEPEPTRIITVLKTSIETKEPLIHFLDPSIIKTETRLHALQRILEVFIERDIDEKGVKEFFASVRKGKIILERLVKAALKEDAAPVMETAERLNLNPTILLRMLRILIQPCLEEIARKVDSSLLDNWWQASCPICGETPVVAKIKHRKRFLMCTFCGAEYASDTFLCVHCGNKDPYTLKFLTIAELPAFQIDFCTKCKHYIKVIDGTRLKEEVPKGFEDVLTLDLDLIAKRNDLVRE